MWFKSAPAPNQSHGLMACPTATLAIIIGRQDIMTKTVSACVMTLSLTLIEEQMLTIVWFMLGMAVGTVAGFGLGLWCGATAFGLTDFFWK